MKKRYSFHHLKNIALGATAAMTMAAAYASPAMAANHTIDSPYTNGWYGLHDSDSLTITNSGSIIVVPTDSQTAALRVLNESWTGSITNHGTIRATIDERAEEISAEGIRVQYGLGVGASITNSSDGTITASARNSNAYNVVTLDAYGIRAEDYWDNGTGGNLGAGATITNSGIINATATGESLVARGEYYPLWVRAYGILAEYNQYEGAGGNLGAGASITNSSTGTITATATGTNLTAYSKGNVSAYGIRTGDLGAGASITNNGTITAAAEGHPIVGGIANNDDYQTSLAVAAYGIRTADLGAGASIINSGIITATASGELYKIPDARYSEESVSANGIETGDLGTGAFIVNSGHITATADETGSGFAYEDLLLANGIETGDLGTGASIINSGTIAATATGTDRPLVSAYGIQTGDLGLDSSITNEGPGIITVTSENIGLYGQSGKVSAYGMETGDLGENAAITNRATITVTASGSEFTAGGHNSVSAFGIHTGDLGLAASITNSGIITATAAASQFGTGVYAQWTVYADVAAYGIETGEIIYGTITNSGTITATATGSELSVARTGNVIAHGIHTGDLADSSISNSGSIVATATAQGQRADADAEGILVDGDLSGTITNTSTGTIAVDSTSITRIARGFGIRVGDMEDDAAITNSGTITTSVTAGGNSAVAWAYSIDTNNLGENASVSNSGTITATATANGRNARASAFGITTYTPGEGASISNSGTITVTATANGEGGEARTAGLQAELRSGSSAINDGSITATANGFIGSAQGIRINQISDGASLVNNGTILATFSAPGTASDPDSYGAYGIRMDNLDLHDTITNNGMITAIAPVNDRAYSLYIWNSSGTGGTIINNGTLNGNIYLESEPGAGGINLNNNGTLAIPALAVGHNGRISGNYTQGAAGTFKVGVKSATEYGRLNVGGTATMPSNANIRVDVDSANTLAKGEVLTVLNAGLLSGSTYNVTDNSLPWQFTAAGMNNTLDITVAEPTGMSSYADAVAQAGFSNVAGVAAGVAAVLDDFYANGSPGPDFDDLLYFLNSQGTPAELADELSKLLPLLGGAVSQATIGSMHSTSRIIQSRLGGGSGGVSFGDETQPDRRMWAKPFGSWVKQDDADGVIGYDASTYGVVLGADTDISNSGYRLGMAFAYAASDVDSNSDVAPQSTDIDSYQLALYGSYSLDKLTELSFQADIGTSNYDGSRTLNFSPSMYSVATADYDSTNYHLGVGIEHDIRIDERNTFTPSARVDYTAVDLDSYTEQGPGGYNLKVDGQTVDELIFAVDGEFSHKWSATTSLTANLGLGYDAINDQDSIASSFVGGGSPFVTKGIDPSALLMRGGLGVVMEPVSGIELVTRYDLEAREDFANHTVSIKLRMPF